MADYGLRIYNESGQNIFNEADYSIQVLDSFAINSITGSRTVSGLSDDCYLQLGYTGGMAVIENIYIDGSVVRWQGTRLDGYDEYRGDVTIHVTVLKRM